MEEEKEENINQDSIEPAAKDFGKVIDALHSKQKLPSLRTYQGDMAEFIKNRNESVISVAVKTKKAKEEKEKEKEEEEREDFKTSTKPTSGGFKMNLVTIALSLVLIAAGAAVFFYVFQSLKKGPPAPVVVVENKIIPYNSIITLAKATSNNFGEELRELSSPSGINIVKVTDTNGASLQKSKDFLNFLKISLPASLQRTLKDDYAVGIISKNEGNSYFLVISVGDYGQAFSAMLEWETNMDKDLSFLNTATSTEVFAWKDLIVKNKDTRGLVDNRGKSRIAYTFLDKNTIFITNDVSVIGDMSSAYASRSVAR